MVAGDIDEAGAELTVEAVTSAGGSAEAVRLDVTVADDRAGVVGSLFKRHGARFDILLNVAGIDRPGYLTDVDESA